MLLALRLSLVMITKKRESPLGKQLKSCTQPTGGEIIIITTFFFFFHRCFVVHVVMSHTHTDQRRRRKPVTVFLKKKKRKDRTLHDFLSGIKRRVTRPMSGRLGRPTEQHWKEIVFFFWVGGGCFSLFSLRAIKTSERESIHLVYNVIMTSQLHSRTATGHLVCTQERSPTINNPKDISKAHPAGTTPNVYT